MRLLKILFHPLTILLLFLIWIWQKLFSFDHSPLWKDQGFSVCRHTPSCSEFTRQALIRFGFWKGSWLGIKRVSSCHPWSKKPADDPVPKS